MENLSAIHIAMLTSQAKGEAGYKRAATKADAIKRLEAAVAERFGDDAKAVIDMIAAAPTYADAQTLLQSRLTGSGAIATGGQNISTGEERIDPEAGIVPADSVKKGKRKDAPKAPVVKEPAAPRGFRAQKITVIEGKDPFRPGTQSGNTWEMMKANPGLTFAEYVQRGGRANTISEAIRKGWVKVGE